jgi:hypothetical protein
MGCGLSGEQAGGVGGRDPVALLGDADGGDLILFGIDGLENGCSREQRDLMLAAAAAEEDAYAEFFHRLENLLTKG